MKTSFLRAPLVLAATAVALSAQAIPFHIGASGTWSDYESGVSARIAMDVDSQIGGYTPLETVRGAHGYFSNGYAVVTLGSDDPYGRLHLVILLQEPVVTGLDTLTWAGTWQPNSPGYLDGYDGIPNGSGTAVLTVTGTEAVRQASLTLDGDLQVVPEPASMVALGLGAAALLRRRKTA